MQSRFVVCACFLLAFLAGAVPTVAQEGSFDGPPPLQQGTGYPVTGRVLCADTQRPARFAAVLLIPASATVDDFDRGHAAISRTDLDGRFTIGNVAPGDYYVTAEVPGYVNEGPAVRNALNQGGDALRSLSGVPRVQVAAGGGSVQMSLQRGAVLAGAVQWDDGSPAAGVQISALPASNGTASATQASLTRGAFPGFGSGGITDDRGEFRISGLSPGSYLVRATVQSPLGSLTSGGGRFPRLTSLSVYAPNTVRRSDATVYTVTAGDQRTDANIVLALSGMHTVSGEVTSSAASVHSGSVLLTDLTDSSLSRRGTVSPDGSFLVPYVPPGNYTLRVNASSQMPPTVPGMGRGSSSSGGDASIRFQPAQASVTVTDGDLTGVSVTVTPATAGSQ